VCDNASIQVNPAEDILAHNVTFALQSLNHKSGTVGCTVSKHRGDCIYALSVVKNQESAFEKKLSEVQKQLQEKVQQSKVLYICHCSASSECSFIAFFVYFSFIWINLC